MNRLLLAVSVIITVSSAHAASPLASNRIPGLDVEQSELLYKEGARLFDAAREEFSPRLGITEMDVRAMTCGVAQFMQGAIEAAAFTHNGALSSQQVAGARQAIAHLKQVQTENCDRPSGGGLGSGNAGDRICKAFFEKYAPRSRTVVDEMRDKLGTVSGADAARAARDVVLAAALVAAGVASAPLWAL